jgi:hypothetical protein
MANTVLSFLKGYTTTAAIGGADMRGFFLCPPWHLGTDAATNERLYRQRW